MEDLNPPLCLETKIETKFIKYKCRYKLYTIHDIKCILKEKINYSQVL